MAKNSKRLILKSRSKIRSNASMLPIVIVNKSNRFLLAQLFDPKTSKTLLSMISNSEKGTKTEKSISLATKFSAELKKKNIDQIIFNRNGYLFHGRIKAFADELRNNNINF